jgi:hypothetical protein
MRSVAAVVNIDDGRRNHPTVRYHRKALTSGRMGATEAEGALDRKDDRAEPGLRMKR